MIVRLLIHWHTQTHRAITLSRTSLHHKMANCQGRPSTPYIKSNQLLLIPLYLWHISALIEVSSATTSSTQFQNIMPLKRRLSKETSAFVFYSSRSSAKKPTIASNQISFINTQHHQYHSFVSRTPRILTPPSSSHSLRPSSSSDDNYYSAAASIASLSTSSVSLTASPDESFPEWWPSNSTSLQKYITFSDHIAHVIVPNVTVSGDDDVDDDGVVADITCENVIQWVLSAAMNRNLDATINDASILDKETTSTLDNHTRRSRIIAEWSQGDEVSSTTTILDPAYRHDPSLLPQENTENDNPNLIPAELLALGSVWYLPYSSCTSIADRFDPSNGIKPTRLNVGDWNRIVQAGDYFRVHFDPRRFLETNRWDWGRGSSSADFTDTTKPGVIVARDDDAGYLIINKPPSTPVHARVDNLVENVASSVGRMFWMERRESILNQLHDDVDRAGEYDDGQTTKRKRRKQKIEQLVYVATPQRLDQNTSGLLVVASKKSFASYFAKLLRTKTSGQLVTCRIESKSDANAEEKYYRSSSCGVHKTYRCLVCVMPSKSSSADDTSIKSMKSEVERLRKYSCERTVVRHFLEPSIRAPKAFFSTVPKDVYNPECEWLHDTSCYYVYCFLTCASTSLVSMGRVFAQNHQCQ